VNDRLEGRETSCGVASAVSSASVWPSKLAGKIQSSVRAAQTGGTSNIPTAGSFSVRGGECGRVVFMVNVAVVVFACGARKYDVVRSDSRECLAVFS
jgi:hypothetical protein